MSYVDALFDKDANIVRVIERRSGSRVFREYPVTYQFFYSDPKGKYKSIHDQPLSRVKCKTYKDFKKELKTYSKKGLHESDLNQTFICLSDNYLNVPAPKLHVAFWDIETDIDPVKGYAKPDEADLPITAISVYLQWLDSLICLAIPPKTLTIDQAREIVSDIPDTYIFDSEKEMIEVFLSLIEDADVLSDWNGTGYDIPYMCNRIPKVLSEKDLKRLCLWDEYPKAREYEKYGKKQTTFDLVGRVHLDYLELYQKYTYEERASYRLDYIGEFEIGERKTVYEGSLDNLYNNDFKKFIEYNRQDTALLNKLDQKLKFIDTANVLAHTNTVLLQTTMGAVAVSEQAIINEAHSLGLKIPDRIKNNNNEDSLQAAGAYVAYPKKGLHQWVGSLDINSLYPSAIRALCMSTETIVGQIKQTKTDEYINDKINNGSSFAAAWEGIFASLEYDIVMAQDPVELLTIEWKDGTEDQLTGAQIYDMIFNNNNKIMLSANGTIFSYDKEGIIPGLLKKWYAERKQFQAQMKFYIGLESGIPLPDRFLKEV
jgi:DNA polymerase elongation subunit (family B)